MLIKKAFDELLPGMKVDRSTLKTIIALTTGFVAKNNDHIEFFGGTLTGVKIVRFTPEDRDKFFQEIVFSDEGYIEETLYALRDHSGKPVINQSFNVSSDIFNLTCVYMIHKFHTSPYLSDAERKEGKILVCTYMLFRFLTSKLFSQFKYPADPTTAQATYEKLSKKFVLKSEGSWSATIRYFATASVDNSGIHAKVIDKMDNDYAIVNMINDIQGRIRSSLNNIYSVFMETHQQGIRLMRNSSFIEIDGEVTLKDRQKSLANYTRYLNEIINDKNSFIRDELVDIVENMMTTMPTKLFSDILVWVSNNHAHTKDNVVEKAVSDIMLHAFDYLSAHKELLHNRSDIAELISKLRGTYMSSRANDELVVNARESARLVVHAAIKTKNESLVSSLRTGLMIYIVLRAITMRHYTS